MYKCEHFCIEELVSPKVFRDRERRQDWWRFFDPRALQGLDALREEFGRVTINNWKWGGDRDGSGFHLAGEEKRSEYSGHRQWGAFDLIFNDISAKDVRIALLGEEPTENKIYPKIERYPDITELEYDISWFHVRFCSNIDGVLVYKP